MTDIELANAISVKVDDESISVELYDGRRISGIHWPELEEDINVHGLLAGHHSRESQTLLEKWLKKRVANNVNE